MKEDLDIIPSYLLDNKKIFCNENGDILSLDERIIDNDISKLKCKVLMVNKTVHLLMSGGCKGDLEA